LDARGGAFASFGRALWRGLPPFINRHLFTSGCGSIYRSRMSHLTVPHPRAHKPKVRYGKHAADFTLFN